MPYTYLIGWSKHQKFYYGARWAKNCDPSDLWKTYFTSSTHVWDFRKEHGEPDIVIIRKIFNDVSKCKKHERKVLERMNVLTEDKWLNKNINGMFLPHGPQSKRHVDKRVQAGIETKKKKGTFYGVVSWTKETNPDAAEKVSKALTGKAKSSAHKDKMKFRPQDTTIVTCPHCNKTGDYKNMQRWHMERCRSNPNRITDKDPNLVTCSVCGYSALQSPNFYRNHNNNCTHLGPIDQSHKLRK